MGLSILKYALPSPEKGKAVGEVGLGVDAQEFSFGHVDFEKPIRHESGDDEEARGYRHWEFGEKSGLGINFWEPSQEVSVQNLVTM